MRIDLAESESWVALSEVYRRAFAFQEPAIQIQPYIGYQHALLEVSQGLAELFSHKKTIAVVGGGEPSFEPVLAMFSARGYQIRHFTFEQAADPTNFVPTTELLFVLFVEDDPVSGRIYDHSSMIAHLKDKRVFLLSISHAVHRVRVVTKPEPFEARVLSLRPDRALLLAGGRARFTPQIASFLPWRLETEAEVASSLAKMSDSDIEQNQKVIERFESRLKGGFQRYFQPGEARTADRAVIYHPGFDGSAVIDELAKTLGVSLVKPGQDSSLESMSLCRWTSPRLAQWLINRGEAAEKIRGLVILSPAIITDELPNHLEQITTRL